MSKYSLRISIQSFNWGERLFVMQADLYHKLSTTPAGFRPRVAWTPSLRADAQRSPAGHESRPPAESHGLGPAGPDPHPDSITPSWASLQHTDHRSQSNEAGGGYGIYPPLAWTLISCSLFWVSIACQVFFSRLTEGVWVILTAREVFICLSKELSRGQRASIGIWVLLSERRTVKGGNRYLIISAWEWSPVTEQHSLISQCGDVGRWYTNVEQTGMKYRRNMGAGLQSLHAVTETRK